MSSETKTALLRYHHLLCLPLFEGKGYSGGFSENMARIKEKAETSNEKFRFICNFDIICEGCPNKSETGCLLNEDGAQRIEDKDSSIAKLLGAEENFTADYKTALKLASEKINRKEFEKLCGQCRWYKAGVCSYDRWRLNVDNAQE